MNHSALYYLKNNKTVFFSILVCLMMLCGYLINHQIEEKRKTEIAIKTQQIKHANDAINQMMMNSLSNNRNQNIVDPMTPLDESSTPEDEIEQIKAWHKLSPEQQLKLNDK